MRGQENTFSNLSYHAGAAISTGLRPRITAWALKKLMQSTHIYRASGVVGYKRKIYAAYDKGRAELPEPDFACRSFRPIEILLGSAFHTKIGNKQQRRVRPETGRTRLHLRLKTNARICTGGQAQAVLARLVCQKARRAAAVNGAKRLS